MSEILVQSLFIYPLKSAQGIEMKHLDIDGSGPLLDREWMLVKKSSKSFLSQRTHPQMSQLQTSLEDSFLKVQWKGQDSLHIPRHERSPESLEVSIFGKPVKAEKVGPHFDDWFSQALGTAVTLVRTPKNNQRQTSGRNGPLTNIRFPDGYPFLLTNTATLDELNSRLPKEIAMSRFRPNIVITGAMMDAEENWQNFKIGSVPFLAVKACARCAIIDVDPVTGKRSSMVTSELKKYRTFDGNMLFGINLSHTDQGRIQCGDALTEINGI